MTTVRHALAAGLAGALAAGLLAAGAPVARAGMVGAQSRAAQPDLRPYYKQSVVWGGCPGAQPRTAKCGDVTVPADYADPGGQTLQLAVSRIPATGPGPRLGSLLVNFGGPGLPGIVELGALSDRLARLNTHYDLVGFDPRGVGASAPVDCGDLSRINSPAQLARACAHLSGWLLPYLTTTNTARDLDVVRGVLGDAKLSYLGFSYGSTLGAVYSHAFPAKVGRMVFDGVPDPRLDDVDGALAQARGFQTALGDFAADCARRHGCPVPGGTGDQVLAAITAQGRRITGSPLHTAMGPLDEDAYLAGLRNALYSKDSWPYLRSALGELRHGNGDPMMQLAYPGALGQAAGSGSGSARSGALGPRAVPGPGPGAASAPDPASTPGPVLRPGKPPGPGGPPVDIGGRPQDNPELARLAIDCRDTPERRSPAELRAMADRFTAASPLFGRSAAQSLLGCTGWPPGVPDTRDVAAPSAPQILLVGTTGDPATPYPGVFGMARALGNDSRVLTYRGEGHGAYFAHSRCVTRTVDAYFLDGRLPPAGAAC
ncbi:alpha/beta hydrolase [Actinacidiphila acididurans]|uniref:Alpha/beta fold hydrolase n=1 Tax=Actinacidiphila acididurans TaxID=2784346 RepID=A0ABS2U0P6_9ACTN|nr:alpha/beta hydrolase [Actinacidiphila acididurans]MBM9508771.1 alpha/beta fold hydrolase [Actinacidiphila acididurans]